LCPYLEEIKLKRRFGVLKPEDTTRSEAMKTVDYDRIAQQYARHRHIHPEVLKSLLVNGRVDAVSKVLEVGCGTGNYIVALEKSAGCSSWGIDPSEQMLAKARERSSRISFQLGRAEELSFPQNLFDLVFSVDLAHHLEDPVSYFQEAYRIIKQDGKICTATDSERIIRHRQPLAAYFPKTVDVDLERYASIAKLREMMEQAGFNRISDETVEFSYQLKDIQAYRDKAFSCLHLIPEKDFQRGIERMERDLRAGPIPCVSRYLLLWGTK
jgi:ubiquinone/menaquinone biosynthesis C-methylase UbiE